MNRPLLAGECSIGLTYPGEIDMGLFSWFRRGSGKVTRAPRSDANQLPDLLEVAERLLDAAQVRALEQAFERNDGNFLRRELDALLERVSRTLGEDHADTATVLE